MDGGRDSGEALRPGPPRPTVYYAAWYITHGDISWQRYSVRQTDKLPLVNLADIKQLPPDELSAMSNNKQTLMPSTRFATSVYQPTPPNINNPVTLRLRSNARLRHCHFLLLCTIYK